MFGKKSREIHNLKVEVEKLTTKNERLAHEVYILNTVKDTNHTLQMELDAANARLREIQDKSNARTRKYRAKIRTQSGNK